MPSWAESGLLLTVQERTRILDEYSEYYRTVKGRGPTASGLYNYVLGRRERVQLGTSGLKLKDEFIKGTPYILGGPNDTLLIRQPDQAA